MSNLKVNQEVLAEMKLPFGDSKKMTRRVIKVLVEHFPEKYSPLSNKKDDSFFASVRARANQYYLNIPASFSESYLLARAYVLAITSVLHEEGLCEPFNVSFPFIEANATTLTSPKQKAPEEPPPWP